MNAREERGLVIAAVCKLNRTPDGWLVPSQSGAAITTVNPDAKTCTCPDHLEGGHKCKHLYAVEFTIKREVNSAGTVLETKTLTFTEKKVYQQDWPAYNLAQSVEKDRFQQLLFDLCRNLKEPAHPGKGREPPSGERRPLRDGLQGLQHVQQPAVFLRQARVPQARLAVLPHAGCEDDGLHGESDVHPHSQTADRGKQVSHSAWWL